MRGDPRGSAGCAGWVEVRLMPVPILGRTAAREGDELREGQIP